jgi:hypothetical protein
MLPISYTEVVFVALANVGSVLVILGGFRNDTISDLATRIGAAFNIPVMFGAIALVHWDAGTLCRPKRIPWVAWNSR